MGQIVHPALVQLLVEANILQRNLTLQRKVV